MGPVRSPTSATYKYHLETCPSSGELPAGGGRQRGLGGNGTYSESRYRDLTAMLGRDGAFPLFFTNYANLPLEDPIFTLMSTKGTMHPQNPEMRPKTLDSSLSPSNVGVTSMIGFNSTD